MKFILAVFVTLVSAVGFAKCPLSSKDVTGTMYFVGLNQSESAIQNYLNRCNRTEIRNLWDSVRKANKKMRQEAAVLHFQGRLLPIENTLESAVATRQIAMGQVAEYVLEKEFYSRPHHHFSYKGKGF
ncbi:MAG: hypothetical protein IT289_09130 [Oligoflexia bacterium]|nr:hypothetical protein [Oligoflexia bacterium]